MDPNMPQQFYKMNNGMDPNMAGVPNGMRPPSSHPNGGFNGQMTPQQMAMAQQRGNGNWQAGPNGQMVPGPNQGGPQQAMGTPQQRAMPPPQPPATNGRTQPSSPQAAAPPTPNQANKKNPKKNTNAKDTKAEKVHPFAFNGFFVRNVDVDDSGLQRRDPPQTSTQVLHRPPMPPKNPRPRPLRRRSPPSIRRASRTVLCSQSPMASHPLLQIPISLRLSQILSVLASWVILELE